MPSRPPGRQDIEWLDLGPPDRHDAPRHPARRSRRTLVIGGAAATLVIALGVATAVVTGHHGREHALASTTPPDTTPAPPDTSVELEVTATGVLQSGPAQVTSLGHPLLGVSDGWELFLRGDNDVVRLQLAAGRVTITPTPTLGSGGSIAFLVTHNRSYVLPSDFVPGFTVSDGAAAGNPPGALAAGGNVYPGPVDGQFWQQVANADTSSAFELVAADGRDLHRAITLPQSVDGTAISDGSGYLIVQGVGGSYDAHPGALRRITTGTVLAVGPTDWLVEECNDAAQCSNVVIDQATWQRQVVGPTVSPPALGPGAMSPNGAFAAVARVTPQRRFAIGLIEMATGAEHTVLDIPDAVYSDEMMAWSPDGHWLFVIGENGTVQVIDTSTLQHVSLGVQLPPAVQLAVRPAP